VMIEVADKYIDPDTRAVALIAYLQRLGTDLTKAPPSTAPATTTATTTAAQPAATTTQGAH